MRGRRATTLTIVLAVALGGFAATAAALAAGGGRGGIAPSASGQRNAGHRQARHHGRQRHHERQRHRQHRRHHPHSHQHRARRAPAGVAGASTPTAPPAPASGGSAVAPASAFALPPAGETAVGTGAEPAADPAPPGQPSCVSEENPMGCPIQTITATGGIQVGNQAYPRQGNWVRLLVLSPDHLTPVAGCGGTCDRAFDADETAALLKAIHEIPTRSDDLVILSGQGISYNPAWPNYVGHRLSAAQISALKAAFEKLGGTLAPDGAAQGGAESLDVGAWSLLGRAGATGGFAEQNYETLQAGIAGFLGGSEGGRGSLNGYLQVVNRAVYEFVSPEFVKVDTSAPGSSATENVITVGDRSYRSLPIEPGAQGYQLLFLPNEPGAFNAAEHPVTATVVTRNADGSLNQAGLHALAFSLVVLRDSSVAGQLFGIVQSFGRSDNSGVREVSNDREWVADEIPSGGLSNQNPVEHFDYYGWCGTGESGSGRMAGYECPPFPNTPTSLGTARSVTQTIGELAGMRARNEVANLGFEKQSESLSLIGPAHPYNDSDVRVAVGAAGKRTIAVLRRSRQSQWTPAGASPGLTDSEGQALFDPAAMWEVVFGEPEPWPVSGPPKSSLAEASRYIAKQLFPELDLTDIRQAYATAPTWLSQKTGELAGLTYPTGERPHFSREDFERLKAELEHVEFPDLEAVNTMTDDYQKVFGIGEVAGIVDFNNNMEEIVSKALSDHEAFKRETATVDEAPSVGSSLYFAANLIGGLSLDGTEGLVGPLDFFAASYEFFSELYGSSKSTGTATQPFGEPQQLRDEAAKLAADMASRYQDLSGTFGHFEVLFDTDWGRLRKAAALASGDWSLPPYSEARPQRGILLQSLATAGEAGLYEALVPIAYDQWVISPWWTRVSGADDNEGFEPSRYTCAHEAENEGSPKQPFKGYAAGGVGMVRFEADLAQPYRNHLTARVLVSKADPLQLEDSGESLGSPLAGYPGMQSAGAAPEEALTEKLFDPPTLATEFAFPNGLGLSKTGFFGLPSWTMPRLQCGLPLAFAPEEEE